MRGGAQSHLMRCDDGYYYVVKFQNNLRHKRVLVNELLCRNGGQPQSPRQSGDFLPEEQLREVENLHDFAGLATPTGARAARMAVRSTDDRPGLLLQLGIQ